MQSFDSAQDDNFGIKLSMTVVEKDSNDNLYSHKGHEKIQRKTKPPNHRGHGRTQRKTKALNHRGHGGTQRKTKPLSHRGHRGTQRKTKPLNHRGHGGITEVEEEDKTSHP